MGLDGHTDDPVETGAIRARDGSLAHAPDVESAAAMACRRRRLVIMKTMEEANEVTERYATRARDASQPKCFVVTQDALEALRVFTERATAQSPLSAAMLP